MSKPKTTPLSPLGAGFLTLWMRKMMREGRKVTASDLAGAASKNGAPVQLTSPWALVLGRDCRAEDQARMLASLGTVDLEEVERLGQRMLDEAHA